MSENVISTVGYRQQDIINDILKLYVQGGIDADLTYSRGQFYKSGEVKQPKLKFDINPQTPDTIQADNRRLPLGDGVCGCVMYDPPFLATKGDSVERGNTAGNIMLRRFGCYPAEKELFAYYRESLKEISRILAPKGIAIVKCQDKVSSSRQFLSHVYIVNTAMDYDLYCEDLFVLVSKSRVLSPKHNRQQHARKYHSYFLVFRKDKANVKRIRRDMNE